MGQLAISRQIHLKRFAQNVKLGLCNFKAKKNKMNICIYLFQNKKKLMLFQECIAQTKIVNKSMKLSCKEEAIILFEWFEKDLNFKDFIIIEVLFIL